VAVLESQWCGTYWYSSAWQACFSYDWSFLTELAAVLLPAEPVLHRLNSALLIIFPCRAAGGVLRSVVGGRYGLGSKDFTPAMAKAVFDNLSADKPKDAFTVR